MSAAVASLPTVIVLAAGRSERFKQSVQQAGRVNEWGEHKLHAKLCGQSVFDHVMDAVRRSGLPFHVVLPEQTQHLPSQGMGDSIAVGVRATAQSNGWLILPADLPLIQPQSLILMALTGDQGASSVVAQHPVFRLALQDQGCVLDVDTADAISQAEKLLRGSCATH
jgi:molybdenum cofactor cytidylyltransferase